MGCPVCRSAQSSPLGEKSGFPVVACPDCGLRYIQPMPSREVIDAYYARYWINQKNIRNSDLKIRRLKRLLKRFLRQASGKRFLDIGCNTGFGVEAARRLGFDATGIDVSGEAIEIGRKLYPLNRFLHVTAQEFAKSGEQFDAVLCREVIEHMSEVHDFAAAMSRLLKPGGLLWLTTPDAGHFRVPKNFPSWKEVIPPEHLCFYNIEALRRLLREYGIEILRKQWLWKPSLRVLARRTH